MQIKALLIEKAVIAGLVALLVIFTGLHPSSGETKQKSPQPLTAKQIYTKFKDGVVSIETNKGNGTGFLLDYGNVVITCDHVVRGATSITVRDSNGYVIPIKKISTDQDSDSALLLTGINQPHIYFQTASSETIDPGDPVFVIGDPLGLTKSITTGVLSAKRQDGNVKLLQFTAPISPGSSGSPLINEQGRVVGFVSFTFARGQSLNMAVAILSARQAIGRGFRTVEAFYTDNKTPYPSLQTSRPESTVSKDVAETKADNLRANQAYAARLSDLLAAYVRLRISLRQIFETQRFSQLDSMKVKNLRDDMQSVIDYPLTEIVPNGYISSAERRVEQALADANKEFCDAVISEFAEIRSGDKSSIKKAHEKTLIEQSRYQLAIGTLYPSLLKEKWYDFTIFFEKLSDVAVVTLVSKLNDIIPDPVFDKQAVVGYAIEGTLLQRGDTIQGITITENKDYEEVASWRDLVVFLGSNMTNEHFYLKIIRNGSTKIIRTNFKALEPNSQESEPSVSTTDTHGFINPGPELHPIIQGANDGGIARAGGVNTDSVRPKLQRSENAVATFRPEPDIPDSMRSEQFATSVGVHAVIDANGRATYELTRSSGSADIDRLITQTLRRWKWKAAIRNGVATSQPQDFSVTLRVK